ncbi:MAG: hypothetical protein MR630_04685 [Selenomonas sp.]|uniref:hypothetical protein n=1 Tax=Selenomonas sp. TaxID=2053611 RepID=UPI0025F58836|nr:hypothetical protein [Selenomonas sp.]MCI6231889.1 hypothetical protein [Selenomonas sp.]
MKPKKFLAAVLAGTVFALAPATGIGSSLAPSLGLHGPKIAYAAKGGVRIAPSAPKAAPAAPKATSPDTHKSVSGNGGSYAPSKSAKDLEKTAPGANAGTNAKAGTNAAASTQSGSRLGSIMRGVGLLAGGMFLGSMLSHLFGFGTGMMSDMLGLVMNILLFAVAFMVIRALLRRFLGGSRSQNDYQQRYQEPLQTHAQTQRRPDIIDIQPTESRSTHEHAAGSSVNGSDAHSIADRYRNR